MADDPEEELFAVVVEEAAMGGVCELEMELLMDSVMAVGEAGMRMRSAGWTMGFDGYSRMTLSRESQIRARGRGGFCGINELLATATRGGAEKSVFWMRQRAEVNSFTQGVGGCPSASMKKESRQDFRVRIGVGGDGLRRINS